jgi:hypothetical protein
MANKRCIPTRFFKDPDIMNLESKDHQLILVGLVLIADDEGRELAHAKLLSRELDYPLELIEVALADLAANDLVVLYQVGRHRYYSLTRWGQWQSLSLAKITPSKYPAPPSKGEGIPPAETEKPSETPAQHFPAFPRENQGNSAASQHFPSQFNSSESNSSKGEGEEREPPHNVVTFPSGRRDGTTSTNEKTLSDQTRPDAQHTTQEAAAILHLPVSDALIRIVQDYQHDPLLHLLGEADAAREYIDDPRRNHKGQRMSPAFFRRWLRREHEDAERRQCQRHATAATGTSGGTPRAAPPGPARPVLPKSLMHLADQAGLGHTPKHPKGGPGR